MEVFIRREYLPNKPAFERAVAAHYSRILEQGKAPMILDLGANVGASSGLLATHFPLALVVSVEPDHQNFEKLSAVAAQFPNIIPVNAAVSKSNGTISLFEGEIHGNNAFRTFGSNREKLRATVPALDPESLKALGAPHVPFIVKIDIEGYEAELFDSKTAWLDEFPIVMAEPHDWMIEGEANSRSMMTSILNVKRDLFLSGENILACSLLAE
jgi:FkbM family methyltransferase